MLNRIEYGNPRFPPLGFLHGFLGEKEDWAEMIPYFQERFHCIAFDLPGHGSSPYSEEILSTVQRALSALPQKPILIGYSLGGRIALQLQDYAKGVIALSAHPGLTTQEERNARIPIEQEWAHKLRTLPLSQFLEEWYAQPLFQSASVEILQAMKTKRGKQNSPFLAEVLMQMGLAKQPCITAFSCPTLFLHGEKDLKYSDLYSRLPQTVTVRSVLSSGHAIHLENPAECAGYIIQWIEEHHANT